MNQRIIKSILTKKFNDWLNSITDSSVRDLVRKNTIITGGAICSLLLKERPNDFDVYFRDINTVEAVARYYVNLFNEEHSQSADVLLVDERVRIKVQSKGVAGDIPDNFDDEVEQELSEEDVAGSNLIELVNCPKVDVKPKYRPVYLTDNAITLSNKIQIVIRFYGSPEEIHKNFDFVHVTNYWESDTGKVVLKAEALESILAKELRYMGSLYPVCSVIRTRKFLKKGWHINAGQYLKMLFQVSELNLNNIAVLEEQLTGVDTAYFVHLLNALKEQKSKNPDFSYNGGYIATIIDRIF